MINFKPYESNYTYQLCTAIIIGAKDLKLKAWQKLFILICHSDTKQTKPLFHLIIFFHFDACFY